MAFLRAALEEALGGCGRLVLISGEPGVGKSTLATALSAEATSRGTLVSSARAPELAGAPPYWLWTESLRSEVEPRGLEGDVPALARILPERAPRDRQSRDIDAEATDAERFLLAEAITSVLLTAPHEVARLVVLDDIHAADPSSLDVLAHVAGRIAQGRVLIVATHRDAVDDLTPAFHSMLARVSRYDTTQRLALAGLDVSAVQRQLAGIVGHDIDSDVARQVHARTGGNPFFTAELARLMTETTGAGGAIATVPARVRDVIAWRLSRLPRDTRDVLETAALIGTDVPIDLLSAACERAPAEALAAVDPAVRAGVMRRGASSSSLGFVHALVAETLAASLPLARAAELHEKIAVAIDTRRGAALDDWLPALAHHWAAAVPSEHALRRTVDTGRLAAQQAAARLAFSDALPLWRLALEAAARAGVSPAVVAELQLGAARALFRTGAVEAALDACRRAAPDAETANRPDLLAAAALVVESVTEPEWAATLINLAETALQRLGDDDVATQARLHAQIGGLVHLVATDDVFREQTESRLALALAAQSGDSQAMQAAIRSHQFVISGPEGAEERQRNAARMIQISRDSGDAWPELWGRLWTVDALVQLGRLAEAEAELHALDPVVARLHWPVALWHVLRARAAILQARGRFDEALESAARAQQQLSGSGLEHAIRTHLTFLEVHSDVAGDVPGGAERRERLRRWGMQVPGAMARVVASLVREGQEDEARALYARMPPVDRWNQPRYVRPFQLATRISAAIGVGMRSDVEQLTARLAPIARLHMAHGSGMFVTLGSGYLYTGLAAAFLGDVDRAVADLMKAVDDNARCGATTMSVVARQELAEVLIKRRRGTDLDQARRLAAGVLEDARRLGMPPFTARASTLLRGLPRRRLRSEELTSREFEVARLVAAGSTNRQIAVQLGLSERTVENHLDHIFRKVHVAGRAHLAAWVTSEATAKR